MQIHTYNVTVEDLDAALEAMAEGKSSSNSCLIVQTAKRNNPGAFPTCGLSSCDFNYKRFGLSQSAMELVCEFDRLDNRHEDFEKRVESLRSKLPVKIELDELA